MRTFVAAALILQVGLASAAPSEATKAEARRHYDAGLAHFNLREYSQAVEEFQSAYRTLPDPVFLYNLAQAYRLADNPEQALYFYQAYLRTAPDTANRAEVEERIVTLQKLIAEKQGTKKPPDQTIRPGSQASPSPPARVTNPLVSTPTSATPTEHAERPPVYRRWWVWTITGVVVAGAAVGLGVGLGLQHDAHFNATVGTFGPGALTVRF
jgi:iron complex outermembrane receptor protein